jgi:concanavalin A-like lectin/glucanase superfamily protein
MRTYHALILAILAVVVTALPLPAQADAGLLAHWRFAPDQIKMDRLQALAGPWSLALGSEPQFFGPAGHEAMMLKADTRLLQADSAVDPATLPEKKFSIEAWIAIDKANAWGGFLSAIEDQGSYERGWLLGYKGDKFLLGVATADTGKITYLESERSFRSGRWYHLVGTYDGKKAELYVDGKKSASSDAPGGKIIYHDTQVLVAGAFKDRDEDYRLVGSLFEIALFNRALSKGEITKRFRKSKDLPPKIEGQTINSEAAPASISQMQTQINQAIDRGVEYLLSTQHRDGSWAQSIDAYPNGMTSLALYTLIKSGLSKDHPAVHRALDYLRIQMPQKTYSTGLQLLALSALTEGKPSKEIQAWAEELTWTLLEMEKKGLPGVWGYPGGSPDLSNTQYAALGLWSAWKMGVDVPVEVWRRMVEACCEEHQPEVEDLIFDSPDQRYGGKRKGGGFTYYNGGATYTATGSMATAGLCILSLAQKCTSGKLGRRYNKMAKRSIDLGLNWLEYHYTVKSNPGSGGGVNYYYLYGVERLAAFLNLASIGPYPWYRDGAEVILASQTPLGSWGTSSDTCFALLFLTKASSPVSGSNEYQSKATVWQQKKGPILFRVTGRQKLTAWITDVVAPARIAKVEYLLDGELIQSVAGDPAHPWKNERYAMQYLVKRPGAHGISVRLHMADGSILESSRLAITTDRTSTVFQLNSSQALGRNLLLGADSKIAVSTALVSGLAARALDGKQATAWVCDPIDEIPWISLKLTRPVKMRKLVLSPVDSSLATEGQHDRIIRIEVTVNQDDPFELEMEADPMAVTAYSFTKTISLRRLQIRILDRQPGALFPGSAGFAEISAESARR